MRRTLQRTTYTRNNHVSQTQHGVAARVVYAELILWLVSSAGESSNTMTKTRWLFQITIDSSVPQPWCHDAWDGITSCRGAMRAS